MARSTKSSKKETADRNINEPKYNINLVGLNLHSRSPNFLLFSRLCKKCAKQQSYEILLSSKPKTLIKTIATCCSKRPDYLYRGMPLKEAIFRIILSKNNSSIGLHELQNTLSKTGVIPPYSTESAAKLLEVIANHSSFYGIKQVPRISKEE